MKAIAPASLNASWHCFLSKTSLHRHCHLSLHKTCSSHSIHHSLGMIVNLHPQQKKGYLVGGLLGWDVHLEAFIRAGVTMQSSLPLCQSLLCHLMCCIGTKCCITRHTSLTYSFCHVSCIQYSKGSDFHHLAIAGALTILPCHDGMCEVGYSALQGSEEAGRSYVEQDIAWDMRRST